MTKEFSSEQPTKPNVSILRRKSGEGGKDFDRSLVLLTGRTTRINGDYIPTNYHNNYTY